MKKNRIKNVYIHRVSVTEEKQNEISDMLVKYYAKSVHSTLKKMNVSVYQREEIIDKL